MEKFYCRGKTLPIDEYDEGLWVVGYYTCFNGVEHRIYSGYAETDCGDYYPDYDSVNPKTVGRWTGLRDKHGKRIFEGDIISVSQAKKESAVVTYDERVSAFCFEWIHTDKCNFMLDFYLRYGKVYTDRFEVVGNIYDNPELMGN